MLTASQLLEQFLFPAEAQWSPSALSGGEKRRLFCCPSRPPPPTCCCWTSRPTIWIFRPSVCWRTIWTPFRGRWWRYPTTAISGSGGAAGVRRGGGRKRPGLSRRVCGVSGGPAGRRTAGQITQARRTQGSDFRPKAEIQLQGAAGLETIDADIAALRPSWPGAGRAGGEGHRLCGLQSLQSGRLSWRPEEKNGALDLPERPGGADFQQ